MRHEHAAQRREAAGETQSMYNSTKYRSIALELCGVRVTVRGEDSGRACAIILGSNQEGRWFRYACEGFRNSSVGILITGNVKTVSILSVTYREHTPVRAAEKFTKAICLYWTQGNRLRKVKMHVQMMVTND